MKRKTAGQQYGWSKNSRIAGDAQAAGEAIERLQQKHGHVQAQQLVDAARNPRSRIHDLFEWDDSSAAEQYRQHQAREVIRSVVVVVTQTGDADATPQLVRAFYHDPGNEEAGVESGYVAAAALLSDRDMAIRVLDDTKGRLESSAEAMVRLERYLKKPGDKKLAQRAAKQAGHALKTLEKIKPEASPPA